MIDLTMVVVVKRVSNEWANIFILLPRFSQNQPSGRSHREGCKERISQRHIRLDEGFARYLRAQAHNQERMSGSGARLGGCLSPFEQSRGCANP
jgi:hypothetical protein